MILIILPAIAQFLKKFIVFGTVFCILLNFHSCKTQVPFGEIAYKKERDSLKSIAFISQLKNIDTSPFQKFQIAASPKNINYRLVKPKNIEGKKWPLIVVFHGSGAIGSDNEKQLGVLSKIWLTETNKTNYPAYIFVPQFPDRSANYRFDTHLCVPVSFSNESVDYVLKHIDTLLKTESIDPKRVYVIGFSMGGATVMNAVSLRPDMFAAAVNISGISRFDKLDSLKNIPIWIVHGKLDTDNPIDSNVKFFEAAKTKGKFAFWLWEDKYHNNIMSEEFLKELPKWLFNQRKQ